MYYQVCLCAMSCARNLLLSLSFFLESGESARWLLHLLQAASPLLPLITAWHGTA